jgi:hypothetical protein
VQVGTYPTRNFALAVTTSRLDIVDWRTDRFRRSPCVAAGVGPSLHLVNETDDMVGVWSLRILRTGMGSPSTESESFLLIVRTSHIVTVIQDLPIPLRFIDESRMTSSGGYDGVSSI